MGHDQSAFALVRLSSDRAKPQSIFKLSPEPEAHETTLLYLRMIDFLRQQFPDVHAVTISLKEVAHFHAVTTHDAAHVLHAGTAVISHVAER